MVWALNEVRLGEPKSGNQVETKRKETKRMYKKQWVDGIKHDLEKFGILNWEERVHDREEWKKVAVKTLKELKKNNEK